MAVKTDGFSNGGGELAQKHVSRRSNFTAIESSGQDERAHDLELGRTAPGHAL